MSFDSLAGELEAASLRVPQAPASVAFATGHALAIAAFVSELQRDREPITLLVCESEGYGRSVTVARWVARQFGCPLHEPAQGAAVASCTLMDSVLSRVPHPAREVARRVPQAADWAVQLFEQHRGDVMVLARCMQILPPAFCARGRPHPQCPPQSAAGVQRRPRLPPGLAARGEVDRCHLPLRHR